MLIRFEVENFRSILGPAELSLVAIDTDRPSVRPLEGLGVSMVTTAGIYGPNAAGKSNLLAALAWLRNAVMTSMSRWDDGIPVQPFAFGDAPDRDTSFTLEMEIDGTRFEYLLDLDARRVRYEALFHYPEGRRRRIFEREATRLVLQRGLGGLAGARQLLTERSLALSIMRRFDEPLTSSFAKAITRIVSLGEDLPGQRRTGSGLHSSLRLFDRPGEKDSLPGLDSPSSRHHALALLQLADLGITDVEVDEEMAMTLDGRTLPRKTMHLIHTSGGEHRRFAPELESAGTSTWLRLIGPLLGATRGGAIVLFDEIERNLHPTLTTQILRLFQSPVSNPSGAQLVFTSHDTNLLNELNRDEIWLAEKSDDGSTRFGALSDFAGERVRRSRNLESSYLSGRFGALPDVSRPDILRELGLIG